ncbi:MAG: sigma-70 family RNA polymerase sigma factor [Ruminococcaceae bacterium]|nr:sigma-70 family RNA polymerase sigma factor [Oscillospiraceae bacterium]
MLGLLIEIITRGFLFFALHIKNGNSFPSALSAKDEKEYFKKFKEGDLNAKNILIEHNLRLVAHITKKYCTNPNDQDDLISIGTIGLIKAVNTFDGAKGIKFATYASKCIENEVLMYFRSQKKSAQDISINEPIDSDSEGNPLTLMDIVCIEDTIADDISDKIEITKLYEYIEELENEREKEIIILRYGLYGVNPLTQKQIAKKLDISRSYVSRIEKRVLEKLRNKFTKNEKSCSRKGTASFDFVKSVNEKNDES